MKKKYIFIILLLACFTLTGCVATNTFLKSNQKDLKLKPIEGGILLSFDSMGGYKLIPNALYIQEINQYKPFAKRKILTFSLSKPDKQDENIYLLNVRVPAGTYLLSTVGGLTPGFFGSQAYAYCGKMFDVVPGEITYIGRVKNTLGVQGDAAVPHSLVEDFYETDVKFFVDNYSILQSKTIKKDMLY